MNVTLSKVIKSGTSKTGMESDKGTIVHLIVGKEPNGYWGGVALCGSKLRRTSNGWHTITDTEVSCAKCIAVLNGKYPLD